MSDIIVTDVRLDSLDVLLEYFELASVVGLDNFCMQINAFIAIFGPLQIVGGEIEVEASYVLNYPWEHEEYQSLMMLAYESGTISDDGFMYINFLRHPEYIN
jgi:hypothetical protein